MDSERALHAVQVMDDWAAKVADTILDNFVSDQGSDDLIKLHLAIAAAVQHAYDFGRRGKSPDNMT